MANYRTVRDVLIDMNTLESAKQFIVITNHEDDFYFSHPYEDEFTPLKGKSFVSRTFVPFSISIHQEVGSHFVYKWDTMNEVVNHFELLFNS